MDFRGSIGLALKRRNAAAASVGSLMTEVIHLRSELLAATVAKAALERQALTTALDTGLGDVSGLLGDTPLPPHLRSQLATELQLCLDRASPPKLRAAFFASSWPCFS